ncbi:MAG: hypothetical protein Q7T61_14120 [Caulobacter sp.]|nr:hypothetical protein [Caulobacter sp.]
MGTKLTAEDAGAYEALDRLLFRQWDPIGVYGIDGPEDEYRSYLPHFWELVRTGASEGVIAGYLAKVERERIQLETTDEHRLDIARKAAALATAWRLPVRP